MVLLQDKKRFVLRHLYAFMSQEYFGVSKGCETHLLFHSIWQRFAYFFPNYSGPHLYSEVLYHSKKSKTLLLYPLPCCNAQQSWSATTECPSGAGSKCKFSKEHLSNINTGSALPGLSDFPLLQKNLWGWNPKFIFQPHDSKGVVLPAHRWHLVGHQDVQCQNHY